MTPPPDERRLSTARVVVGVLLTVTLGAIAWNLAVSLPRAREVADLPLVLALFSTGLALPYALALLLLTRRGGDGLRLATGSALVNALWVLPLGAVLLLFAGFTMGNRDQEEALAAVVLGGVAQLLLLAAAPLALRHEARADAGHAAPRRIGWTLALVLPIVASGASWTLLRDQIARFGERGQQAIDNEHAAERAIAVLRDCLAARSTSGYPSSLDTCPDAARLTDPPGYRVEYTTSLPGADGRIGAWVLCATPRRYGASGFQSIVADESGRIGMGVASASGCAPLLGGARAIAYCAYVHTAHDAARGYPQSLAEIASCVERGREGAVRDGDRLTSASGDVYAYLPDPPDARGRIGSFRVHLLRGTIVPSSWIDDQGGSSPPGPAPDPVLEALPLAADPERFATGCAAGRAADCFYEGYEWQRRGRQRTPDAAGREAAEQRRALDAFARGCARDDAHCCFSLASSVELGDGTARDPARAAGLYERACDLGSADACLSAALIHEHGRRGRPETLVPAPPDAPRAPDVPPDVRRAIRLSERACTLGSFDGCFIAARLLAADDTPGRDPARALALFARLCTDGLASACLRAAALDPAAHGDYARRACVLGDPTACGGVALAR